MTGSSLWSSPRTHGFRMRRSRAATGGVRKSASRSMQPTSDHLPHALEPTSPWLNFEAGALATRLEVAGGVPLYIDLAPSDVTGPLADFQGRRLDKDDVRRLVHDVSEASGSPIPVESVDTLSRRCGHHSSPRSGKRLMRRMTRNPKETFLTWSPR
jgi:hypothetical protein